MQRILEAIARLTASVWLGGMVGVTVAAVQSFKHFGVETAGEFVPPLFRWTDWFGAASMLVFVFAARRSRRRAIFAALLAAAVVVTRLVIVPRIDGNNLWHHAYEGAWTILAAGAAILVIAGPTRRS